MWKSTFWITFCALADILLAFVLQVILAARFGATGVMDAYLVATTIPTLLIGLLPGALNICLIPIFVEHATKGRKEEAFAVSNGVIVLFGLILGSIVVAGELAAFWVIKMVAPGFDTARLAISSDLFRVLLPTVIFYGMASILGSVYYAQRKPFWPALSPVLRVAGMLAGVAIGQRWGIMALVWGDVLGTGLSLAVLGFNYLKSGGHRYWQGLWTPGVRRVMALLLPWLAGFVVSKANPLVERSLASGLSVGSITYLGYASQIVNLVVTVMTKGLALSIFPILSEKVARQDFDGLREIIGRGVRGLLMIVVPVIVLVILYGQLGIQVVFERGAFDPAATRGTYLTLLGYLGALLALPMGVVITNTFYAFQDTRTVAGVAIIGFITNVALNLVLVQFVKVTGLAMGYSIAAVINLCILCIILVRRLGRVYWWNRDVRIAFAGAGLGGALSWLCVRFATGAFSPIGGVNKMAEATAVLLVVGTVVFSAIYVLINYLVGNGEFQLAVSTFRTKLGLVHSEVK